MTPLDSNLLNQLKSRIIVKLTCLPRHLSNQHTSQAPLQPALQFSRSTSGSTSPQAGVRTSFPHTHAYTLSYQTGVRNSISPSTCIHTATGYIHYLELTQHGALTILKTSYGLPLAGEQLVRAAYHTAPTTPKLVYRPVIVQHLQGPHATADLLPSTYLVGISHNTGSDIPMSTLTRLQTSYGLSFCGGQLVIAATAHTSTPIRATLLELL